MFHYLSGGVESGKRNFISAVVINFVAFEKAHNSAATRASLSEDIAKLEKAVGTTDGVTKTVTGKGGQIAVFSDRHDVVLLFEPISNSSEAIRWHCSAFPKLQPDSMCVQLGQ
jgi:hypothetical protein